MYTYFKFLEWYYFKVKLNAKKIENKKFTFLQSKKRNLRTKLCCHSSIQDDAGGEDYSGKDPEAVDPGADYANEPPKSKEESASDSQTEKGDAIL